MDRSIFVHNGAVGPNRILPAKTIVYSNIFVLNWREIRFVLAL